MGGGEFGFTLLGPKDGRSARKDVGFFEYNEIFPTLEEAGLKLAEDFECIDGGLIVTSDTKLWHIHIFVRKLTCCKIVFTL